jgi:hypothetical protein
LPANSWLGVSIDSTSGSPTYLTITLSTTVS